MYCQKLHEESYAGHEFLDSGGTFTIKLSITKMQVYIYIYIYIYTSENIYIFGWFTVLNVTFNYISVISWWSVLLMEEPKVPGENH